MNRTFPVLNVGRGFGLGQASTISFSGAPAGLELNPEMVRPVPGEVQDVSYAQAQQARKEFIRSSVSLEGLVGWVESQSRPASWRVIALDAVKHSQAEFEGTKLFHGKTGNPDAEHELEMRWWNLWKRYREMYLNPPSWIETAADKIAVFAADFAQGAQDTWQGYASWAVEHSGAILEDYHDAAETTLKLRARLERAKASGLYGSGELATFDKAVVEAEDSVRAVRDAFFTISGGLNLDAEAQDKFGDYQLGVAGPHWIVLIAGIIVLAALVALCVTLVKSADRVGEAFAGAAERAAEDAPDVLLFVGVAVLGLIAIPLLIKGTS